MTGYLLAAATLTAGLAANAAFAVGRWRKRRRWSARSATMNPNQPKEPQ